MAGYGRARADWVSWPSQTTVIRRADLNQWDQAIFELKSEKFNVSDAAYGAVINDSGASAKSANVAAFNAAIADANAANGIVTGTPGTYYFTAGQTLTTLAGARGMRFNGLTTLEFSVDGNCLVTKGTFKVLENIYAINRSATHSATDAVIRIKNCAYGDFRNLYAAVGTAGSPRAVMLEHEYDGSAADADFIAHLGCWYNNFSNVSGEYLAASENIGYGISFEVNANAVGVVNPPGQPAGTYTGSVRHNNVVGLNVEGKARGVNLDRAYQNTFSGGQFIGSVNQVYGRNSSHNAFIGQRYNQWATAPFDMDSTCIGNQILLPSLFNVTASPWSLGAVGAQPVILAHDDSILEYGLTLRDLRISRPSVDAVHFDGPGTTLDINRPDNTGAALRLGNGTHLTFGALDFYNSTGATNIASLDNNGSLLLRVAGQGLFVKEGTNAKMGTAVLVAGTKVVSTTAVTANSRILLTSQADGGAPGFLRVSARTAGTSFTILSSSGTDTSTVGWLIVEPS